MAEFFYFWGRCIKEGWSSGGGFFSFVKGLCAIITVAIPFLKNYTKTEKWKTVENWVLGVALVILLVTFVFVTLFIAPFRQFQTQYSAASALTNSVATLTSQNQAVTNEKNDLQRKQDKAETLLGAANLMAGNTNGTFTEKVSTFVDEFNSMKHELSNTTHTIYNNFAEDQFTIEDTNRMLCVDTVDLGKTVFFKLKHVPITGSLQGTITSPSTARQFTMLSIFNVGNVAFVLTKSFVTNADILYSIRYLSSGGSETNRVKSITTDGRGIFFDGDRQYFPMVKSTNDW